MPICHSVPVLNVIFFYVVSEFITMPSGGISSTMCSKEKMRLAASHHKAYTVPANRLLVSNIVSSRLQEIRQYCYLLYLKLKLRRILNCFTLFMNYTLPSSATILNFALYSVLILLSIVLMRHI